MRFAAVAHLVLCLGLTLSKTVLAVQLGIWTPANFPGPVLARKVYETWTAYSPDPPRIVVSYMWLGGNVIANGNDRVAVLIPRAMVRDPSQRRFELQAAVTLGSSYCLARLIWRSSSVSTSADGRAKLPVFTR